METLSKLQSVSSLWLDVRLSRTDSNTFLVLEAFIALPVIGHSLFAWSPRTFVIGDCRASNSIPVQDNYPIPNMLDFSYNLRHKKTIFIIDLVRAYNQIPMVETDIHKTAITTPPFGLLEFLRMRFDLRNPTQPSNVLLMKSCMVSILFLPMSVKFWRLAKLKRNMINIWRLFLND